MSDTPALVTIHNEIEAIGERLRRLDDLDDIDVAGPLLEKISRDMDAFLRQHGLTAGPVYNPHHIGDAK